MKSVFDPTLSVTTQVKALGLYQMGPTEGVLLYKFFDRDYGLLYVGVTCTPTTRWQAHKNRAEWWPQVAWVEVERHPHNNAALNAERLSIRQDRPRFNHRSFPGRSRNRPGMAPESPGNVAGIIHSLVRGQARARRGALETGDRRQDVTHPSISVTEGAPTGRNGWMETGNTKPTVRCSPCP